MSVPLSLLQNISIYSFDIIHLNIFSQIGSNFGEDNMSLCFNKKVALILSCSSTGLSAAPRSKNSQVRETRGVSDFSINLIINNVSD